MNSFLTLCYSSSALRVYNGSRNTASESHRASLCLAIQQWLLHGVLHSWLRFPAGTQVGLMPPGHLVFCHILSEIHVLLTHAGHLGWHYGSELDILPSELTACTGMGVKTDCLILFSHLGAVERREILK